MAFLTKVEMVANQRRTEITAGPDLHIHREVQIMSLYTQLVLQITTTQSTVALATATRIA